MSEIVLGCTYFRSSEGYSEGYQLKISFKSPSNDSLFFLMSVVVIVNQVTAQRTFNPSLE